jgi:hypothetical protein
MNSSHQHFEDKLGRLVREALNARVGTQEPPKHTWTRIAAKLETERAVASPICSCVPALSDAE